jgi:choline kinase
VWHKVCDIKPDDLRIHKVSGSLTNAVFFIFHAKLPTLLLRVYGSSSHSLISRPHELHTLHILGSKYNFGPLVFGTFQNGRIEEYFESTTLTAKDIRDPTTSELIAMRMGELHRVDISAVEDEGWDIGVRKNIRGWIGPAREVWKLLDPERQQIFNLDDFVKTWENYWNWIRHWEAEYGESLRVFAHNDAQYGNLLRLDEPASPGKPEHHQVRLSNASPPSAMTDLFLQIIVVDFEYASPNPAAFDIANHFHEWTVNYHGDKSWFLDPEKYPTHPERQHFYKAYLTALTNAAPTEQQLITLDHQVRVWSPASHAMWAIWGIVQAKEDLETKEQGEFDYLRYAECRLNAFKRDLKSLDQ